MTLTELFFALMRKSSNILKDYAITDKHRKNIINMKCSIASRDPALYKLVKLMATDPDRFEISSYANIPRQLENGDVYGSAFPKVTDKVTDLEFFIRKNSIDCKNIDIFTGEDHSAFIAMVIGLNKVKIRTEQFMVQRKKQTLRNDVLSNYE